MIRAVDKGERVALQSGCPKGGCFSRLSSYESNFYKCSKRVDTLDESNSGTFISSGRVSPEESPVSAGDDGRAATLQRRSECARKKLERQNNHHLHTEY
ncbi:hypothetical protein Q1695_013767 [Nippostrongylus brasiliensis]|nr:hypothetical protein Q1695_013767 [Nippostrongylus brasiliensis]